MSELKTAALTAFLGILVLVIGQFLQKFILEPIQELRKHIGEIGDSLIFYANAGSGVEAHYFANLRQLEESQDPTNK